MRIIFQHLATDCRQVDSIAIVDIAFVPFLNNGAVSNHQVFVETLGVGSKDRSNFICPKFYILVGIISLPEYMSSQGIAMSGIGQHGMPLQS